MEASAIEPVSVRIEEDVIIESPIEDVFARLIDISHYSDWMARRGVFKQSRQLTGGPVGLGTRYVDRGRMGTFRGEVVEFEALTRVVFKERLRWFGASVVEVRVCCDSSRLRREPWSTRWPKPRCLESFGS